MKVKDVERMANVAWSPATQLPIHLAAGTAAQLDASFSTHALLEVYALNLAEPGMDMELRASIPSQHQFHKIAWGAHGATNGTIVGGCDDGIVQVYNANQLLNGEEDEAAATCVSTQNKHKGPVHALDFNHFQPNLLATGAAESEMYIWDLNNTSVPMTPGAKSQPYEDVLSIAWNKQVQHILASTFVSKCVVWDLRKNEPIIKLMDTVSRIRWKVAAWHPEIATQLCLASEEDHAPVIQLWDLRFATSPLKTLASHQRGVISIAWCSQDADLLGSVGKDNRILCWNPNSNQSDGEVLSEIATTNQWSFDIAWCPKNPALIACPNFDGHISIYSVMGGQTQQVQTTNKIADSFPGMDGYVQASLPQQNVAPISADLSKAPKWLKRPVGASFGFGGKLISFSTDKSTQTHTVFVSQLITEPKLVEDSAKLEQTLEYGNFIEYCNAKADSEVDSHKKDIWRFLKANFDENPRNELLTLLGYNLEERNNKLNQFKLEDDSPDADEMTERFANLNKANNYDNLMDFGGGTKTDDLNNLIQTGDDTEGLITEALLLGNTEAAVELCFKAKRYADAIIISMTGGSDLLAKTQIRYLQQSSGYISSLISALVSEDWSTIIEGCNINSWKEALVASLTHCNDQDLPKLCDLLGGRLEMESQSNPKLAKDAQLCYVCAGNFDKLVYSWSANIANSAENLQELVELVTFLQKAVERQGRNVEITGKLAELLCDYALILASQGSLNTALSYLGSSTNEHVVALRDRLSFCLGRKQSYALPQVQPRSRTSSRQSFSSYPPQNPFSPPQNQSAPLANQNPFNAAPPPNRYQPTFNTGLPNQPVSNQPWQQQPQQQQQHQPLPPIASFSSAQPPVKTFSPPPPPRPTSVGSTHGGSGLSSRTKYVVDPSVQSGNMYGGGAPYAPLPSAAPTYFNQSNVQSPGVASYAQPPPASFVQPLQAPVQGHAPLGVLNPMGGFDKPEMGQIASATISPPGWNDPPVCNKPMKAQPKQEMLAPDPITHPLYGCSPMQELPPSNGYVDMYSQPSLMTPSLPQATPQIPPNTYQSGFTQNALHPSYQQQQQQQQPAAPQRSTVVEQPQIVEKAPVPEEHRVMQVILDELREKCLNAANNPQTKRKLEDVGRKLEVFYDLLREQKLSLNTLSGLHQLVQVLQSGDYPNGLNVHTQLVSGPDFSQIASFMPGLKVLIQCALQLQVYLR